MLWDEGSTVSLKFSSLVMRLEWSLQGTGLANGIWRLYAGQTTCLYPLLAIQTRSKWIQGLIFGVCFTAGHAVKLSVLTAKCLQGTIPGFMFGFSSIAFSMFGYDHKAVEVKKKNQGFLDGLFCWVIKLYLLDILRCAYKYKKHHLPIT